MAHYICSQAECGREGFQRGLCRMHYDRFWRDGTLDEMAPKPPRVIPQTCPPDHKHGGSLNCYKHHQCRCTPCSIAYGLNSKSIRHQRGYGTYVSPMVDATPVRAHLVALAAEGFGRRQVAEASGFADRTIQRIRQGYTRSVFKDTADTILAVTAASFPPAPTTMVSARGTARRVQALAVAGWSFTEISRRLGYVYSNVDRWITQPTISLQHAEAVADLFDELWDEQPPRASVHQLRIARMTSDRARRNGWLPALAWDDIDEDDAPAVADEKVDIDEMAIEIACEGVNVRLRPAELRIAVARLHPKKYSDTRMAAVLHVAERTVWRIRGELGLEAFAFADLEQERAS